MFSLYFSQDLSRKHGVPPERLGSMQEELRAELDELVLAAEALPLATEKEAALRLLAEQVAGQLSAVRRRCVNVRRRPSKGLEGCAAILIFFGFLLRPVFRFPSKIRD